MKSLKFLSLSIILVACFLFSTVLSAQYSRVESQGISFLVSDGLEQRTEDGSFVGEHKDYRVMVMSAEATEENIQAMGMVASLVTESTGIVFKQKQEGIINLGAYKGVLMEGIHEDKKIYLTFMVDREEKNAYLTLIETASSAGEKHAETLLYSFK